MAADDAHVFPGFLTPEGKFASTGDRTQNHKVVSPTSSPLSLPWGAAVSCSVWFLCRDIVANTSCDVMNILFCELCTCKLLTTLWQDENVINVSYLNLLFSLLFVSPARVAQWWACRTHDLVVLSSIPGWGDFSFRRIFASHLCRSMWEK